MTDEDIQSTIAPTHGGCYHIEKPMMIDGKEVGIDEGIYDLVKALNDHGLHTIVSSCQGHSDDVGFVSISMENVKEVIHTGTGFSIVWEVKKKVK